MKLSFVLPYYKRFEAFREALAVNIDIFTANRTEVMLVLDEPTECDQVVDLITHVPGKWRVMCNDKDHPWRPPCRAINVGVKNARGKFVCVLSPETHISLPYPSFLVEHSFPWTSNMYLSGVMHYNRRPGEPFRANWPYGFGMLMVKREKIEALQGWDEDWDHYGGEDDDIRRRLEQIHCNLVVSQAIKLSHYITNDSTHFGGGVPRTVDHDRGGDSVIKNGEDWGTDFLDIVYEK